MKNPSRKLVRNLKERGNVEDQDGDGRIILNYIRDFEGKVAWSHVTLDRNR
jgi:hypothetical protein